MRPEAQATLIVAAPVEVVYRAAGDIAHYPLFMLAARVVTPVEGAPDTYRWVMRTSLLAGTTETVVSERVPDARVAWRSLSPRRNDGVFELEPVGNQTRATLRWACDHAGTDPVRAVSLSLANFKRAVETGQPQVRPRDPLVLAVGVAAGACMLGVLIGVRLARGERGLP